MVWTIILAAGESKRMGRPKMLLPWENSTILETVVWKALSSRSEGVLVVLGADRNKIERLIWRAPVRSVYNEDFAKGMLSSVRTGLKNIPAKAEAAVIALGDQPHIPQESFDLLIDSYKTSEKGILLPTFRGRRGHPILIDMKYREEIFQMEESLGLKGILRAHPDDILEVPINDPGILKDIDTAEDYNSMLSGDSENEKKSS